MLDFRRHRRATRPSGAGLERRILMLIVGSGLVVLLIVGAGNPRNWKWLAPDEPAGQPRTVVHDVPDAAAIVAIGEPGGEESSNTGEGKHDNQAAAADPADRKAGALFPGVRLDYLSAVRDDTVFRGAESDAWFHLLAVLARTPNDELARASEGPLGYLQLDQQPGAYRGRLVTVGGVVRAAKHVAAPDNAFDVAEYYQLWLQPDRQSSALVALYCLELPHDFPLGAQIDEPCTASGFFFKRWAYQSQGGITTAPLILARTVDWRPSPVAIATPAMPPAEQALLAIAVALLLAVAVLGYVVWRGRVRAAPNPSHDEGVAAALASLAGQENTADR